MNATELRIGNYILGLTGIDNPEYDICKITQILNEGLTIDYKDRKDYYMDYDCYKPIPLTQQWLIDFGFKKIDSEMIFKLGKFKVKAGIRVVSTGELRSFREYKNGVCLDYVHILQNLYFALKEKELIKNI